MIPIKEHDIQKAYFDWVRSMIAQDSRYEHIWAVPNAGKRTSLNRIYMWQEGFARGYPDVVIDYPMGRYHGARIEAKNPSRRGVKGHGLSKEQVAWLTRLGKAGFAVQVCFSLDEMMTFTRSYFALKSCR